jgi:hypothetical protein
MADGQVFVIDRVVTRTGAQLDPRGPDVRVGRRGRNQTANFVPFAVSSGVANVGVRPGAIGLELTEMDIIVDTTNSVQLSEPHADSITSS